VNELTELQPAVIEMAQLLKWHVVHFRPAQNRAGAWVTPVAADGKGWVDLVLVRDRVIYRELKSEHAKLTPEQETWGEWLLEAGCDWGVWRPHDWLDGRIEAELRRRAIGRAS
jgi:hypothetical protein